MKKNIFSAVFIMLFLIPQLCFGAGMGVKVLNAIQIDSNQNIRIDPNQYVPADMDTDVADINNALPVAIRYPGVTPGSISGDGTYGLDVDVTRISGNVTVIQGTSTSLKSQIYGDDTTNPINTDASGDMQVDIATIAAGDNNIGNVDIVTLPSGNLGQQAKASSLSVAPATDITDATYIGDIKFGESLPSGSAVIGGVRSAKTIVEKTSTQNLTAGALSYTTNFAAKTKVLSVEIVATGAITETVAIYRDSGNGAGFDSLQGSESLVAEQHYVLRPESELVLDSDDELRITCTNAGGVETISVLVQGETVL